MAGEIKRPPGLSGAIADLQRNIAALMGGTALAKFATLELTSGPGLFQSGSAAAPGISWAGDTNTGLYRPADDQIGFATGGAEVARITASGIQLTGVLTGTAVTQSATDTGSGRLLKVGDFGIGGRGILLTSANDLNAITANGIYYWTSSSVPANAPGNFFSSMIHQQVGESRAIQIVTRLGGVASINGIVHTRTNDLGTWHGWQVQYARGNALGVVSQSGGVPTGALFEIGSGGNGRYERRADGYMECYHTLTASAAAATTWTFPSAFVEAPVVTMAAISTVSSSAQMDAAPTTTAVTFSCRDKTDARRADVVHLRATGRWSTMA